MEPNIKRAVRKVERLMKQGKYLSANQAGQDLKELAGGDANQVRLWVAEYYREVAASKVS